MMKKLAFMGLLVITTTGCGQGWLPFRPFRGAPCGANCVGNRGHLPACLPDCHGTAAGFGGYDAPLLGDPGYYGGEIIGDSGYFSGDPRLAPPSMDNIPSSGN